MACFFGGESMVWDRIYQQNIGGVALSSATWFWTRDPFAKTEGEEGMVSEMCPRKILPAKMFLFEISIYRFQNRKMFRRKELIYFDWNKGTW